MDPHIYLWKWNVKIVVTDVDGNNYQENLTVVKIHIVATLLWVNLLWLSFESLIYCQWPHGRHDFIASNHSYCGCDGPYHIWGLWGYVVRALYFTRALDNL